MSPNNTPEIRDLLNDLHGYQCIKKIHLYFQMRKMTCTDISTDTIFDPSKREKSVFKVDYLSQDGLILFTHMQTQVLRILCWCLYPSQ